MRWTEIFRARKVSETELRKSKTLSKYPKVAYKWEKMLRGRLRTQ